MATLIEYATNIQVSRLVTYVQINGEISRMDSDSTYCHSTGTEKACIYASWLVEGKNKALTVRIEQQQYKAHDIQQRI